MKKVMDSLNFHKKELNLSINVVENYKNHNHKILVVIKANSMIIKQRITHLFNIVY
jgi:hypothetical protein